MDIRNITSFNGRGSMKMELYIMTLHRRCGKYIYKNSEKYINIRNISLNKYNNIKICIHKKQIKQLYIEYVQTLYSYILTINELNL
jgi:hypothetical protein